MNKKLNPFRFGQRVMVPSCSHSRVITEIVSDTQIRVMDLVEITDRQRADWTRNTIPGELKFIPGMVVDIDGVDDWDQCMSKLNAPLT